MLSIAVLLLQCSSYRFLLGDTLLFDQLDDRTWLRLIRLEWRQRYIHHLSVPRATDSPDITTKLEHLIKVGRLATSFLKESEHTIGGSARSSWNMVFVIIILAFWGCNYDWYPVIQFQFLAGQTPDLTSLRGLIRTAAVSPPLFLSQQCLCSQRTQQNKFLNIKSSTIFLSIALRALFKSSMYSAG